jgi:Tfp pilus assembly protein PilW
MRLKDQRGFTISELLVAAGLSLGVMASIYGVFRSNLHTVKAQESRMEAHEYAMVVLDNMMREIRNTGYFPTVACNGTGGVVSATATLFALTYDANSDGDCADTDEAVTYQRNGNDITRTTNSAQTLTDGNVTDLRFIYYPQQTGGTLPPPYCYAVANDLVVNGVTCSGVVSANLANIQKVTISVTVQSKNPDVEFGGQSNVTMSSSADLRNHGLAS